MKLFGKKEEKKTTCACGSVAAGEVREHCENGALILGGGCAKCNALELNVREAAKELGLDLSIGHVTDFAEIASYGVMNTPALVLDGKPVSQGKVLTIPEVKEFLQK